MTRNYEKSWNVAFDNIFCQHVQREHLLRECFKIHMIFQNGALVKPLQAICYLPVRCATMVAGNYMCEFLDLLRLFTNPAVQFENPAVQTKRDYGASFSRNNTPSKIIMKSSGWSVVGPMAVGHAKLWNHEMLHLTMVSVSSFCVKILLRKCWNKNMICTYSLIVNCSK